MKIDIRPIIKEQMEDKSKKEVNRSRVPGEYFYFWQIAKGKMRNNNDNDRNLFSSLQFQLFNKIIDSWGLKIFNLEKKIKEILKKKITGNWNTNLNELELNRNTTKTELELN